MCDHLKLEEYIKGIIECLLRLKADIELANSIKRYDVNLSAEDIYRDILNALFEWELKNLNNTRPNAKAIDLIDAEKRILVQVSSRRDKVKVQESLDGLRNRNYDGYTFYYVCIVDNPPRWRTCEFEIPDGIIFQSPSNVLGVQRILNECKNLDIMRLEKVFKICQQHFAFNKGINSNLHAREISKEEAQLFIAAFADIRDEIGITIDICEGYLKGIKYDCDIPVIEAHLHEHLKNKMLLACEMTSYFRRTIMDIPELWQKIKTIQGLVSNCIKLRIHNEYDVQAANNTLRETLKKMLEAMEDIASRCHFPLPFKEEFCS